MDWDARLTRAEKKGEFTPVDKRLAQEWTTCAVSEHKGQYRESEWDDEAAPGADGLNDSGCDFYSAVWKDNVAEARALYGDIQKWFRRYRKRTA